MSLHQVELAKELELKKEELRTLMRDLAREKQKTDSLLFSMLPKEVANDLREGRHVQAGNAHTTVTPSTTLNVKI